MNKYIRSCCERESMGYLTRFTITRRGNKGQVGLPDHQREPSRQVTSDLDAVELITRVWARGMEKTLRFRISF